MKSSALAAIISEIHSKLADIDGEKINVIEGSVKKLLEFNEKGGNVDFVAPDLDAEEEEALDGNEGGQSSKAQVYAAIRDYQAERESLKLITDSREQKP